MEDEPSTTETDDNEDDPIVKEIPIINSRRLHENLYLFQYPLLRKNNSNELAIKKCHFKPINQELKLEMGINIESPNFDTARAEIIAHEVDGASTSSGKKDTKQVYFNNEIVDKVFLDSSKPTKQPQKYAIAAFNGREIHLNPLKGVFQLRAKFPYLEKGLKRRIEVDSSDSPDEEEAGPSSAQQVTVRFKQTDDRWKKTQEASFKSLQAKSAEETWTECDWYDRDSSLSNIERLKLISDNLAETGQVESLDRKEYLRLLVPEDQEHAIMEPTLPSHVLSLHSLRQLPLIEQCRLLLKDAQIIQFQQLLMLLTGGEGLTAELLLKTLPKVAVLVRGNWVVKSEVLYPSNTFSATSGVPAELMCRARDYVLYLFTKNQYVERKKISSVMKIPSEEVKEIFTGISKLRHNKGWELSLPGDQDFLIKHIDVVQKQMAFWEQRYHQLTEFLRDNKEKRQRRKSKSVSEDNSGASVANKLRSNGSLVVANSYTSSDNDSGTERSNKSPIVAKKLKTVKISNNVQELNS